MLPLAESKDNVALPATKRGRRNESQQAEYRRELAAFADRLKEIRSSLDFKPGKRGWCYLLEEFGIGKGDFDRAGNLIDECRKSGLLPIDFTAADDNRAPMNLEDPDQDDPDEYAHRWMDGAADCWKRYDPGSLWDFQNVYIEVAVEKIDLRSLFAGVCAEYRVPIWNCRGWSDINSRADLMNRCRAHAEAGRHCVLLYCGDFDPSGLHISESVRSNLQDLADAVDWAPDSDALTIERFGLNFEFIEDNNLSWIDGLETSSGRDLATANHPDHNKPFVKTYLSRYGARKVEANALVTRPEAGRQLCRDAIERHLDLGRVEEFRRWQQQQRQRVRAALPAAIQRMATDAEGGE